ncbi:AEC family transporter [Teichococcus oryzae]|uniref:AEC family transporter n=1 Tax=Teichococcus oryzae TaxID=1608942 RepID=A0A5B2THE7_9PROT|nr:AEC family transporter [Pseudoroseomonas oryzae]KAA2213912.1 AEC family transporter [Pseudoroseomonas oryzae]
MAAWVDAFSAIFGLIGLGWLLRQRMLPDPAPWAAMEKLVFTVLLPALLVSSISAVNVRALPLGTLAGTIWATLLAGTLLSVALARLLRHGHATMTSVLQGGIRYNTLIAFAIVGAAQGQAGLALGGIATGLIVPCVQTIITVAFAMGGERRPHPLRVLRQVLTNPLILACLAGLGLSLLGGLPPGLNGLLRALAQGSLAVGLLCVGAALTPQALASQPATQFLTAVLKLLVMPALATVLALATGLDPLPAAVAILFIAQPTAPTAYVQARLMGGDAPIMAAMITTQHLAAMATLPFWVWLLAR